MKNQKVVPCLVLVALAWACSGAWADVITADQLAYLQSEENVFSNKKIIDISHKYVVGMPYFYGGPHGLQPFFKSVSNMKTDEKAFSNSATFTLSTHSGTHCDAPGHFNQTLMDEGYDVDSLDLRTLNGPVLVVDTPRDKNITAEVMKSLNIPRGVKRVIFKTLNTDRNLMNQSAFEPSYTGFTTDGAKYLVENTDIKLVGIDYLSIATGVTDELKGVHLTFLNQKDIIPVEDLKLDEVVPGIYTIHCLPLRLVTLDGSPARCILIQ
ncbi:unnamed protein product [Cuscuta epithymum]|uniref:Cyclase n=1 Tax=Cuscuta epithymum TaxID=186058 RepID=A0AAV0GAQ3_9ASTE|nr:unnamed protein product [Cuscuta epithymum]